MESIVRTCDAVLDGIELAFRYLANLLLLTMLVINFLNIAARFFTNKGVDWVFPWTTVLFVWMTFFGFFVVYRRGKDITVDFVMERFGSTVMRLMRVPVDLAMLALLGVFLSQAPDLLSRQVGNLEMVGLQRYWLSVPFFLSCLLIAVHLLLDIYHALHGDPEPHRVPAGDI